MTEKPTTPADPRDGEPFYVDSTCECGEELILYDELTDEQKRSSDDLADPQHEDDRDVVWQDEWCCPQCLDGIHMDWPDAEFEELDNRMDDVEDMETVSVEELKEMMNDA